MQPIAQTIRVRPKTPTLFSIPGIALDLGRAIWLRQRATRRRRLSDYLRHHKPRVHVAKLSPNETVESNLPT